MRVEEITAIAHHFFLLSQTYFLSDLNQEQTIRISDLTAFTFNRQIEKDFQEGFWPERICAFQQASGRHLLYARLCVRE